MAHNNMYSWVKSKGATVRFTPRDESYNLLKSIGLPTIETKVLSPKDIVCAESINEYISSNGPFLALAYPNNVEYEKKGTFDIKTGNDLMRFLKTIENPDIYELALVQQISGIEDGYVGTSLNNNIETFVEILTQSGVSDVRDLTSKGADPKYISNARFMGRILMSGNVGDYRGELSKIRDMTGSLPGYYEFIKGEVNGKKNIWFTDYQNDPIYRNLLE